MVIWLTPPPSTVHVVYNDPKLHALFVHIVCFLNTLTVQINSNIARSKELNKWLNVSSSYFWLLFHIATWFFKNHIYIFWLENLKNYCVQTFELQSWLPQNYESPDWGYHVCTRLEFHKKSRIIQGSDIIFTKRQIIRQKSFLCISILWTPVTFTS